MKALIIALLFTTTSLLTAQAPVTWLGGAPGKETRWEEPNNWSNHSVPDEFSFVIIKQFNTGHNTQPIIDTSVEVASIEVHGGASLTISETGNLVIDGENTFSKGLLLFGGEFINKGNLTIRNIEGKAKLDGFAMTHELH